MLGTIVETSCLHREFCFSLLLLLESSSVINNPFFHVPESVTLIILALYVFVFCYMLTFFTLAYIFRTL